MYPRTSVFIAELKNQQIQTGSKHTEQVQEDSDGLSTTERFTASLIATKLLSTRYDLVMCSMCWCGFTGEGGMMSNLSLPVLLLRSWSEVTLFHQKKESSLWIFEKVWFGSGGHVFINMQWSQMGQCGCKNTEHEAE